MAVLPKDIAIVQDPKRKIILWCSDQISYLEKLLQLQGEMRIGVFF